MQDDKTPQAGWVFTPGGQSTAPSSSAPAPLTEAHPAAAQSALPQKLAAPEGARVSWSASEYIANPKNVEWFSILGIGSLVLAAVVYLLTRDVINTGIILVLGIIVGVFAARQPQVLDYHIDEQGIHIGPKFYPYPGFKSFSVVEEGAFAHISLMPLKRFMPPLAIHFAPDDEEKIIDTLADYLPYEEHKIDMVDSLSRRLRF